MVELPKAALRKATDDDLRFVYASWLSNYWCNSRMKQAVYQQGQRERMARLMQRSRVTVAHFPEVPDEILGWSCLDTDAETLHYLYVKGSYRRRNIGTALLLGLKWKWYTHEVDNVGKKFASVHGLSYNPFKLEMT